MTVLENTLVPLNMNNKAVKKKAMDFLERVGIAQYANKYPHQLSGGQCQRAAIVRALMNNPKVIFGDEPTAALDHESACEVMKLLSEYTDNTMVVIVTHDESLLESADKIICVRDGEITRQYTPEAGGCRMKPLNPFFYFKRNMKKTLPIFVSVAVGVLMIYIFSLFAATTKKMVEVATFDLTDKYNIVYYERRHGLASILF